MKPVGGGAAKDAALRGGAADTAVGGGAKEPGGL